MSKNIYTNAILGKGKVLYRGYDANGDRVHRNIEYSPSFFLPSKKTSKYKTLSGENVEPIKFSTINEAWDFVREYKDLSNFTYYGNTSFQYCYIGDMFPEKIDFDFNQLRVLFLDIETAYENGFPEPETADQPILAITLNLKNAYYVFGLKDYQSSDKNIHYFKCASETELLRKFLDKWQYLDPDIISGWNISSFDNPYLINRITKVLGEKEAKKLSPWGYFSRRIIKLQGKEEELVTIPGIEMLDMLDLYKKFSGKSAENYKLDTIAQIELDDNKTPFDGSLKELYENDHQKYIDYNIQDVKLVKKLEEKTNLIGMAVAIAYDAKANFGDIFTPLRLWDAIIFNYFKKNHLALPLKKESQKDEKFEGAFVKEPQIGMFDWVVSFDLDSLYPNLIRQFNISPETLLPLEHKQIVLDKLLNKEYDLSSLKTKNMTMAASGHHFSLEKEGFLGKILMNMYDERKADKNRMLAAQKQIQLIEQELTKRGLKYGKQK